MIAAMKLKHAYSLEGKSNLHSILKSRDKGPSRQGYGFSTSHVRMSELDGEES